MSSKHTKATLVLEDGSTFSGFSFGSETSISGEIVFNTGMVGYPESLTDPSYAGQLLVLTFPIIGNYGIPPVQERDEFGLPKFFESDTIHIRALIVSDYSHNHSHWNVGLSLSDWLKQQNVPALYGIDTRLLTKKIRAKGTMLAKILFGNDDLEFNNPNQVNLVSQVSCKQPRVFTSKANGPNPSLRILAVDCGMKNNIIRQLAALPDVQVKVVPWDHEFSKEQEYDGLFISNGPGDPTMCWKTVQQLQLVLEHSDKPVFGICLGNQLMSLAVGAKTYKMKFGNRGMNQPCIDARTNKCYITPQNHGFAVDTNSLPAEWKPFFYNANDGSNEGIYHTQKPFFSVQFHPEAKGGPTDTAFLFDLFLSKVKEYKQHGKAGSVTLDESAIPKQKNTRENVKKVLILGSGGLSIGQAGEFDYSGSQCIKALKEHNIKTVLINPNIATCQTSQGLADKVYFVPITPQFVKEVCAKEKPDGVLLTFGGQTALNCGIQLYHEKFWEKSNIRVLGTPIETIIATEDREIFARKLEEIGVKIAPSLPARSIDEALEAATKIGYPIIVRAAYALGGLGSGFAHNETELRELVSVAFSHTEQVLVEKSLKGWKEIEYEVVRDCNDNCITVCNMENFDPLGIHTGDSIVIAPSLTLSNEEFYKLRSISIKTIRHLGVVGECNIQFGLDPHSEDYFVIEVNARLSRSSALASKATGYPLAFVAAKLSLGIPLTEIKNSITRTTTACFEPSLDYIVVKFPRWDLQKFDFVSRKIGSAMKSVGEVMSIGRTFEEVIQKAIRMVAPELDGFCEKKFDDLDHELESPSEQRIFAIALALKNGYTVDQIHDKSKIDKWFLYRLQNIVNLQREISQFDEYTIPTDKLLLAKQWGFSDRQIATCLKSEELEIRKLRKKHNILPYVKQIDTTAAEYPAQTNYLYMTYNGSEHDVKFNDYGIMVLGSGAYRIGSSVEFDWCAVSCVRTLRSLGFKSIMLNFNPETVSTDYDECDKLYFEELSFERVIDIYEAESSSGVILSVGGQTPNNLAMPLSKYGVKIHGTAAEEIDKAENRFKFSQLLDSIHVDQPSWRELTNTEEALEFAENVSYPVLVRPSYVLSGAAMNVAHNSQDLTRYLTAASDVSKEHPVVISKFIEEAKEVEMDAIACNGEVVLYAISEHVENAGVHSGDATLVLPAQNLYVETMRRVKGITKKIAKSLNITGPFNIQYLAKENDIKVIECNLRASRTFPFISKVFNINFIEMATKLMVGVPVKPIQKSYLDLDYVGVKAPMFSFTRLHGADPILGVEMASTGEVACFSENKADAFLISLVATGFKIPRPVGRKPSILLMLGTLEEKASFLNSARKLVELGFEIYTSSKTGSFLLDNGVPNTTLSWPYEEPESPRPGQPTGVPNTDASSMITYLEQKRIDIVINIPNNTTRELSNGYHVRRAAADLSVSLITNLKCAKLLVEALERVQKKRNRNQPEFEVKSWDEYMKENHL